MNDSLSPSIDPEAQSAPPNNSSFGEILTEFEESRQRQTNGGREARLGRVVSVTGNSVFVDVGLKVEGVLPADEFRDAQGEVDVNPGDTLTVSITGRDSEGYYLLSKLKVERPKDWSSLQKAFAERHNIAGVVTGVVKGGLSVDVGVRAFLPASRSGVKDLAEMEQLIGQEIRCRVIELDVSKEDVVVDRRVVLEEEEAQARQRVFDELQEETVVTGTVRTLTQFGAFVDLGGIDGLLHVGDMSWGRISQPSDVYSEGDSIQVKILKVDRASHRISLGVKQLSPEPWTLAPEKYKPGQRVRGVVSKLMDFGAFVELEPGVEGLIHISEMSWSKRNRKPKDILKRGEFVEVVVLSVNGEERRMALGLKQALGDPWEGVAAKFPPGTVVEGSVVNLAKFGAFVELSEGLEGMIHITDISHEKRFNHAREALNVGQNVRATVLEIDPEKRRMRLGMKQLEPTSVDEYIAEHRSGDFVSGRLIEIGKDTAKVELGEGIYATSRVPAAPEKGGETADNAPKADLETLTAMLSAKWKQGKSPDSGSRHEPIKAGQIRRFRILTLDAGAKKIDLELAG